MKYLKKTIGIGLIGISISLFVALIPFFLAGQYQTNLLGRIYYLNGRELFGYLLSTGVAVTVLFCLRDFKTTIKSIMYPILLGIIMGILLGFSFPTREYYSETGYNFNFNNTLMLMSICLGGIISLIIGGVLLTKQNSEN